MKGGIQAFKAMLNRLDKINGNLVSEYILRLDGSDRDLYEWVRLKIGRKFTL